MEYILGISFDVQQLDSRETSIIRDEQDKRNKGDNDHVVVRMLEWHSILLDTETTVSFPVTGVGEAGENSSWIFGHLCNFRCHGCGCNTCLDSPGL